VYLGLWDLHPELCPAVWVYKEQRKQLAFKLSLQSRAHLLTVWAFPDEPDPSGHTLVTNAAAG